MNRSDWNTYHVVGEKPDVVLWQCRKNRSGQWQIRTKAADHSVGVVANVSDENGEAMFRRAEKS